MRKKILVLNFAVIGRKNLFNACFTGICREKFELFRGI